MKTVVFLTIFAQNKLTVDIGLNIKRLRKEREIKQHEIADLIGMHRSNYSKIENGQREISIAAVDKIAKFFNITIDELIHLGEDLTEEIKVEDIKELLGLADTALIAEFVDFLSKKKGAEAVSFLEKTFESGFDPQEFAKALVSYLRQAMLLKINPAVQNPMILGLTKEEQEKMKVQVESLSQKEIQRAVNLFMEAESKMKYSSIPELPLELALVDFIQES